MFSRPDSGRRRPHIPLISNPLDPIRIDEFRLAAWALALGQDSGRSEKPPRRPHRGQLPDVDFSRAVPAPRRPGLVSRLFRLLTGRRQPIAGPAAGEVESGADDRALGEAERKPYLKLAAGDSDAATPENRPTSVKSWSRAA
ncbi:hypothetical protein RB623_22100 [Mesorhizobium sp. LHD-90]|uniref:hypothetical protein n=1 Tax=Mesorhizobium sp. LHD-90 TaxID=3071414 RepID=UPI0027DF66B0|nr:hypothetical protein [Mesorhizobium sp. LHD-90]MDQ6436753.1 hypothetical protein [Mesorhizobium sp. LHD-90]